MSTPESEQNNESYLPEDMRVRVSPEQERGERKMLAQIIADIRSGKILPKPVKGVHFSEPINTDLKTLFHKF